MNQPAIGKRMLHFDELISTNLYATTQIRAGLAEHGDCISALNQTEGRGQRGKKWYDEPGKSLLLSVVIKPQPLHVGQQFRLSVAVALSVVDFLKSYHATHWRIKWPNDIYWNDRKAGGILIENIHLAGRWTWAVVGIGININTQNFDPQIPNPVSLQQITQGQFSLQELYPHLASCLNHRWAQLKTFTGWQTQLTEYNTLLYGAGKFQKLRKKNMVANVKINHVNNLGQLVAGDNQEYHFDFGEVEWVF